MFLLLRHCSEDKARYKQELDAFRAAHPHVAIASPVAKKRPAKAKAAKAAKAAKGPKRKAQKKQDEEIEWDSDASDELVEQALAELAECSEDEEAVRETSKTAKASKAPASDKGKGKAPASDKTPVPQLTSPTGKQRSASSAGRMRSMAAAAAQVTGATGATRTQKRKVLDCAASMLLVATPYHRQAAFPRRLRAHTLARTSCQSHRHARNGLAGHSAHQ